MADWSYWHLDNEKAKARRVCDLYAICSSSGDCIYNFCNSAYMSDEIKEIVGQGRKEENKNQN